jgi:hypothetical protein
MDPDWPGEPPKPDGEGWIWASSVADLCTRFRLTRYETMDVEIVAAANPAQSYEAVHEKLYFYGPRYILCEWTGHGYTRPGRGSGYDIEGRGGAWVRRIEPAPWCFESDGDDDD